MEMKEETIPVWLDSSHPNFLRWKRGRELSVERGKFVKSVSAKYLNPIGLRILDLGSGEGGTSKVFEEENFVVSLDISKVRLMRQAASGQSCAKINGTGAGLPFKKNSFDLIILQDVIEHVEKRNELIQSLFEALKENGYLYLSTPNKFSILNIISDPHWGLPLLSLFSREKIKKYFLKIFRKDEINRVDIAELLSLKDLQKLFGKEFKFHLNTKYSVQKLLEGDRGIVWSGFHLSLVKILKNIKLDKLILMASNDAPGFLNKYLNPTFYIMLEKKP